jgi:hypothetical protein
MLLTASPVTKTRGVKAASKDLFDRCNATRSTQSDVDNHQIRAPTRSRRQRVGDTGLHGADRVTKSLKRFREQSADHRVVLDDQCAKRFHRITSPTAPPSPLTAIRSNNLDPTHMFCGSCRETLLAVVGAVAIFPRPLSGSFFRGFDDPKLMIDAV